MIQKAAEEAGDRWRKVSKNSQQNNSETVTNEDDKEISKERYIYLQKKDKTLLIIWD